MQDLALKPIISEKFSGKIWKIVLDEKNNLVAIESRNAEKKQVAFSVINYKTGELFLKDKILNESWLLNLLHISDDHVYFSLFAGENRMFQSSGLMAYNYKNDAFSWQNFTIGFWQAFENCVKVYNLNVSPKNFSYINWADGKTLVPDKFQTLNSFLKFPEISADGLATEAFVEKKKIKCIHEKNGNKYNLRLTVTEGDTVLVDDILQYGIQKLLTETFFLQQNRLFYIRSDRELISYFLQ